MESRCTLCSLAVLGILFGAMSGCSQKDEAPPVEEETPLRASTSVAELQLPQAPLSPEMEQFLAKAVRAKSVAAGHGIREFFDFWQEMLHTPRIDLKITFDLEVEGSFEKDHYWENTTYREILDDLCRRNNLVWTLAEPNVIRVTKIDKQIAPGAEEE